MKWNKAVSVLSVLILLVAVCLPVLADGGILMRGESGEDVVKIQERLIELNYLDGEPTGEFDERTEKAVVSFQNANGLLATGMVDAKTREVLFSQKATPYREPDYFELEEDFLAYESAAMDSSMSYAAPRAKNYPKPMASQSTAVAGAGMWMEPDYFNTTEYTFISESGFVSTAASPLSTFAADVDTASYAQVRSLLLAGEEVPADAVRIEEMLNYFTYDYPLPDDGNPFGISMEMAKCPWNEETMLLQIGLQGKSIMPQERPRHNLVFLIDVSGSMFGPTRLDLVKKAFLLLLEELEPTDTISLVTYASRDATLLSGVPAADKVRIMDTISSLQAGGSTNSESGIVTAYKLAEEYAGEDSINRIILATDGDFNVGMTSEGELARLVMDKKKSGVSLTALGVGYGNYKDNKLEALADYGDGNYYYLDSVFEARRALVTEAGGTFVEIARDVKLNLDFNPAKVKAYRLIGYEDRVMSAADFADDTKDGGEIGSGHRVTVLYEIVPVGSSFALDAPESKYAGTTANSSNEWLTLNIRYKKPGESASTLETHPFADDVRPELSDNMKFAAAVAECGMLLRKSEYSGEASFTSALQLARSCNSVSGDAYKEEFIYLLTLLERSAQMK